MHIGDVKEVNNNKGYDAESDALKLKTHFIMEGKASTSKGAQNIVYPHRSS